MENIAERLMRYCRIDTTSAEGTVRIPSFDGGERSCRAFEGRTAEHGNREDVEVTEDCFVFATLPASEGFENKKTVGILAHLDTAPDCSGRNVEPQLHRAYDGGIIRISDDVEIDPEQYPELLRYVGDDIVTSDGTTLLGADDKAGISIIMDTLERLVADSSIRHGRIRIAFTPDEEISVGGASIFDVDRFGR
jgi:tripeptide aminopeptidase